MSARRHTRFALNDRACLDDEVNAFALPVGSIRLCSGLMDLMSDDEVCHVVGHGDRPSAARPNMHPAPRDRAQRRRARPSPETIETRPAGR